MHILFFNRSFYPDTSATGQLLTELCESLVESHGCSVSVVAGVPLLPSATEGKIFGNGLIYHREQYQGVDIFRARGTRFSKHRFIGRFTNYISYFLSACYTGFRVPRPDVVVALTDPPIIGLAAYLVSRRHHVPLVMSYRDIFPEVAQLLEDFHSKTIDHFLHRVTSFLARKANKVIALGEEMRRKLIDGKGADPEKVLVIPDWADCSKIVPAPKRNHFSLKHGLADKFVVMHSGNIGHSQELEKVVEAVSYLGKFEDIVAVFVGEGAKKPDLLEQVERMKLKNVLFLPYQSKERLTESLASADIFIISLKKGMAGYIVPSKVYGILASGRPYVAAVEEPSEVATITKKYMCGVLAEPGDSKDLADKILMLYRDHTLLQQMGHNARQASFEFDRGLQVRNYYNLFLQSTQRPNR